VYYVSSDSTGEKVDSSHPNALDRNRRGKFTVQVRWCEAPIWVGAIRTSRSLYALSFVLIKMLHVKESSCYNYHTTFSVTIPVPKRIKIR
jgi:hypothetical protein